MMNYLGSPSLPPAGYDTQHNDVAIEVRIDRSGLSGELCIVVA